MKERGQVTIFIIVAVIILVVIALFFFLKSGFNPFSSGKGFNENPESYLQKCIQDDVYDVVRIIGPQGGYFSNSLNKTFSFEEEGVPYDISYLCYAQTSEVPCRVLRPFLSSVVEEELKKGISREMDFCMRDLEKKYEEAGYSVEVVDGDFDVSLVPNKVLINVDERIRLNREGESREYEGFKVSVPSTFSELVVLAETIVNREAENCDFDFSEFWRLRPEYKMSVFETQDGSKIYTVRKKDQDTFFRFIIRGCVEE